jgi:hypothetical protein
MKGGTACAVTNMLLVFCPCQIRTTEPGADLMNPKSHVGP